MHGAVPEVAPASARLAALLRGKPLEGLERSFKLTDGGILGDRFLAGFSLARVGIDWVLQTCRDLDMPAQDVEAVRAGLPEADVVHFGCEAGGGVLYKVYLEYPRRLAAAGKAPRLLHVAWKWDAQDPSRRAVAHYRCLPGLTLADIEARIDRLEPGPAGVLLKDVAALSASRSTEPLMYLEVNEEGNARASFDLNVHAAGLALREIEPQLRGLRAHFGVPVPDFDVWFAPARGARLGHVAGGLARSGVPFATFYYAGSPA